MRITYEDVKREANKVNELTKNINIIIGKRYDYIGLDVANKNGVIIDTILAGLTKREAYNILYTLYYLLRKEYK